MGPTLKHVIFSFSAIFLLSKSVFSLIRMLLPRHSVDLWPSRVCVLKHTVCSWLECHSLDTHWTYGPLVYVYAFLYTCIQPFSATYTMYFTIYVEEKEGTWLIENLGLLINELRIHFKFHAIVLKDYFPVLPNQYHKAQTSCSTNAQCRSL